MNRLHCIEKLASTGNVFTETLLQAIHTSATHIPSKGVTGEMLDVLQSRVDFTIAPIAPIELALPQLKSGKIGVLAQTASRRSKRVPDVSTVGESGYPGFEATFWTGLYAPSGTPIAIVTKLNRAINEMLTRPDVLNVLEHHGMKPSGGTAEQFLLRNKADRGRFSAVTKSANITAD